MNPRKTFAVSLDGKTIDFERAENAIEARACALWMLEGRYGLNPDDLVIEEVTRKAYPVRATA